MKFAYSAVTLAVVLALTACKQETRTVVTEPSAGVPVAAQIERQVENAGAALDDASITGKVKAALIADPRVKGFSIDVDTKENVVTLNGAVASAEAREQAVQIAKSVSGVKDVKNNLGAGEKTAAGSTSDTPEMSQSIQHLQKAEQRLRESIQAMAQEKPGTRRNQAIKDAQDALLEAKQAMAQLPPELRDGATATASSDATGSTSSSGASGSVGSSAPDASKAMERLQKSAQQLRESAQAMAQQPAGPRRNEAIKGVNRALMDVNEAMTQLPPDMRSAK